MVLIEVDAPHTRAPRREEHFREVVDNLVVIAGLDVAYDIVLEYLIAHVFALLHQRECSTFRT